MIGLLKIPPRTQKYASPLLRSSSTEGVFFLNGGSPALAS